MVPAMISFSPSRGADAGTAHDDDMRSIGSLNEPDATSKSMIAQIVFERVPKDENFGSLLIRKAQMGEGTIVMMLLDAGLEKDYNLKACSTAHQCHQRPPQCCSPPFLPLLPLLPVIMEAWGSREWQSDCF